MPNNDELRWQQRFENFERAWLQLNAACAQSSYSELELAGLVQMFEFTFELARKTLKDLLFYEGYEVNSPRDAIRQGFAAGLVLGDCVVVPDFLEHRSRRCEGHAGDSLLCNAVNRQDRYAHSTGTTRNTGH